MNTRAALFSVLVFAAVAAVALGDGNAGPSDYFSAKDGKALTSTLSAAQGKDGSFGSLEDTYHAVAALRALSADVPNKSKVCAAVKSATSGGASSIADTFYGIATAEALSCGSAANDKVIKQINTALKSGNLNDVHFAVATVDALNGGKHTGSFDKKSLGKSVSTIVGLLDDAEGTFSDVADGDTNALATGRAYQTLARIHTLAGLDAAGKKSITDVTKSTSALMATGTEDEEMIVFEDPEGFNLRATSELIAGLASLSAALKDGLSITDEQVVKLSEYLVSTKTVSTPAAAHYVLQGFKSFVGHSQFKSPIVISLIPGTGSSVSASGKDAKLRLEVTDLLGGAVGTAKVTLLKAYNDANSDKILLRDQTLTAVSGSKKEYELNFLSIKPSAGFYTLDFAASVKGKYISIDSAEHTHKVTAKAAITDLEVSVSDTGDYGDIPKSGKHTVKHPEQVKSVISIDTFQHLHLNVKIVGAQDKKPLKPHQVFVRFTNTATKASVVLLASAGDKKVQFQTALEANAAAFKYQSGKYELALLVGDALIENAFEYTFATAKISFKKPSDNKADEPGEFEPSKVIEHQFRQPEKRPPVFVSLVFTGAVLAPILVLFILLGVNRINFANFPSGTGFLYAAGFHGTILAILLLFVGFWVRLSIFDTLQYLLVLGIAAVFLGNKALKA